MKAKLFVGLIALCGSLFAQGPQMVTKIVRVKASAQTMFDLACNGVRVRCQVSEALHALVLRGETGEVASVEETIQALDKLSAEVSPPSTAKNIELTTYVIGGSDEISAGVQEVTGEALAPVIKQLKSIFPYKHYQLLSTMLMRAAPGSKAQTEGLMKNLISTQDVTKPSIYQILVDSMVVSAGRYPSVHLRNFKFYARIPYSSTTRSEGGKGSIPYATTQLQQVESTIQADLDIQEGQKVVVGKTNISDSDKCLFVVLTARLL